MPRRITTLQISCKRKPFSASEWSGHFELTMRTIRSAPMRSLLHALVIRPPLAVSEPTPGTNQDTDTLTSHPTPPHVLTFPRASDPYLHAKRHSPPHTIEPTWDPSSPAAAVLSTKPRCPTILQHTNRTNPHNNLTIHRQRMR